MNAKVLWTCTTTAILYVLLEMALHSGVLSGLYQKTAAVWRPQSEMQSLFPLMLIGQAMFGFFFGLIYTKGHESGKGSLSQGLRFGLWMGLAVGPVMGLLWYVVLPIPRALAVGWGAGAFLQMLLLGAAAGSIYQKKQ
jgi:hypothetical protein